MRKKLTSLLLMTAMAAMMSGCNGQEQEVNNSDVVLEQEEDVIESDNLANVDDENKTEKIGNVQSEQIENVEENQTGFGFADLKNIQFTFSSGAGAWSTELYIHEDGRFEGLYSDSDMGSSGEGYPNGTRYFCQFTGQFDKPVKVNEYTYSLLIEELEYAHEVGKEEILDEVLYVYSEAYGLYGTKEMLLYLPGAPVDELSEGFMSWVRNSYYYEVKGGVSTELPAFGLYNEAEECGFSSYNIKESVETIVTFTKERAAELEYSIQNDDMPQIEYNEKARQLYDMWDMDLNTIWSDLKLVLNEEEMEKLLEEQREWIAWKEEEIKKAGAEYEGGSMQPMVMHLKGAELTEIRVYELLEYLG